MKEAAEELTLDELPAGSTKEQQIFSGLVFNLGEALRCFGALMGKPSSAEQFQVTGAAYAKIVELKKDLRHAQLAFPLIRPVIRTQPARPAAPLPTITLVQEPSPVGDAMQAAGWLLESIHQIMAMPNRLTRPQREVALDLSDALTDFVPVAAVILGKGPEDPHHAP